MGDLGPPSIPRSIPPEQFYKILESESGIAGVTRLGDLTNLDRIGFPVWQAVRPAGRAQSVHQGKGWRALDARIGALGEALESHFAERVEPDGPCARWEDLPPKSRYPEECDCFNDRTRTGPGPIDWCEAHDLSSGRLVYLPHLFVSLDFTVPNDTAIERSSAGLAIGTTEHEAIETALLEAMERDAIGAWRRMPNEQKTLHRIRLASIPFEWFKEWSGRVRGAGAHFRVFAVHAIEGTPVCIVYLAGSQPFGSAHRIFMGTAAHGSPETALFKAMAEALQSRLTFIAGSRDDILPSLYDSKEPGSLLGAAGLRKPVSDFTVLQPANSALGAVASRLATLGYDQVAVKRLSPPSSIPVVKVFVPGLGSLRSVRRSIK